MSTSSSALSSLPKGSCRVAQDRSFDCAQNKLGLWLCDNLSMLCRRVQKPLSSRLERDDNGFVLSDYIIWIIRWREALDGVRKVAGLRMWWPHPKTSVTIILGF